DQVPVAVPPVDQRRAPGLPGAAPPGGQQQGGRAIPEVTVASAGGQVPLEVLPLPVTRRVGRLVEVVRRHPSRMPDSTSIARSIPASSTSRWVTSRASRGPITETSTPCARAAAASAGASTGALVRSSNTMLVRTRPASTTPYG